MSTPRRVLFVCLGNICRSPAAEGVMREHVRKAGQTELWSIASAGTAGYHVGNLPDERMQVAAARRGYPLTSRAQKLSRRHLQDYDLVLVMDEDNLRAARALAQTEEERQRVQPFWTLVGDPAVTHIPDPYYGGLEGFETVLDLLEKGCRRLLGRPGS